MKFGMMMQNGTHIPIFYNLTAIFKAIKYDICNHLTNFNEI